MYRGWVVGAAKTGRRRSDIRRVLFMCKVFFDLGLRCGFLSFDVVEVIRRGWS